MKKFKYLKISNTKKLRYITEEDKSYNASLLLGEITDTLDVEGQVVQQKKIPTLSERKIKNTKEEKKIDAGFLEKVYFQEK